MRKIFLSLVCLAFFATGANANVLMTDTVKGEVVLTPYLSWLPDPEAALSVDEANSPSLAGNFAPLSEIMPITARGPVWIRLVMAKTPPPPGGSLPVGPSRLMLNMGMLPPGSTHIYIPDDNPQPGGSLWKESVLSPYDEFELPSPGYNPSGIFIRMDETPGMWFDPKIIPHEKMAPEMLPFDLVLPGLLLLGVLACLLRAVISRAPWALWAAIYLACGLVQCLSSLPSFRNGLSFTDLPAILAPGLALLLLPQIGRYLASLKSPLSGFANGALILFSLAGAALCLVPLLPGLDWITRLYPVWPLLLLPMLPVCFALMASGRPGALSFTWAALLPAIGAGVALFAVTLQSPHPLMHNAALWGMAVGGLAFFFTRTDFAETSQEQGEFQAASSSAGDLDAALSMAVSSAGRARNRSKPSAPDQDELNLKIISEEPREEKAVAPQSAPQQPLDDAPAAVIPAVSAQEEAPLPLTPEMQAPREKEDILRKYSQDSAREILETIAPVEGKGGLAGAQKNADSKNAGGYESPRVFTIAGDHLELVNDFTANTFPERSEPEDIPQPGEEASVPAPEAAPAIQPDVQEAAPAAWPDDQETEVPAASPAEAPAAAPVMTVAAEAAPVITAEAAAPVADKVITFTEEEDLPWSANDFSEELKEGDFHASSLLTEASFVFDLGSLVRDVHESIAPLAKQRGLVYSWYVSPDLPVLLEGDAPNLRQALTLLLQNAVRATEKGTVQLTVRNTTSTVMAAEHCRVLFTIVDSGTAKRSDAGFFHAWQLASRTNGTFDASYSPEGGTKITFIVVFALPGEDLIRLHLDRLAMRPVKAESPAEAKTDSVREAYLKGEIDAAGLEEKALAAGISLENTAKEERTPLHDPGVDRILIADTTTSNRRLLVNYLSGLPHEHVEAPSIKDIPELLREQPVSLVIFDADMPETEIVRAISKIREYESESGFSALPVLALVSHEAQAGRMTKAGATQTLAKPFDKLGLENAVNKCLGRKEPAGSTGSSSGTAAVEETYAPHDDEVKLDPAIAALLSTPASRVKPAPVPPKAPAERDPDPLAEALRDIPQNDARPSVNVELPPINLVAPERKAAPVILSLSEEDVSPAAKPVAYAAEKPEKSAELKLELETTEPDPSGTTDKSTESSDLLELMILDTDEEQEETKDSEPPAPQKPETPKTRVVARVTTKRAAPAETGATGTGTAGTAPQKEAAASKQATDTQAAKKRPESETPSETGAAGTGAPEPEPAAPQAPVKANTTEPDGSVRGPLSHDLEIPEPVLNLSGKSSIIMDDSKHSNGGETFIPLPGFEGERVDLVMLPLLPGVLYALRDALADAEKGKEDGKTLIIQEAAGRLAGKAELFNLDKLGKLSRCVERAAEADDLEAAAILMQDLSNVTNRYMDGLQQCYERFLEMDR